VFSVYNVVVQKPFTLDTLAQAELEFDWFYSHMTPEQRDFYLRAALKIGAREAARYAGQDVDALTRQLGASVYEPEEVVRDRDFGSGPYAEYDAETRQITVHQAGLRYVAFLLHQDVRTIPDYALWNKTTQNAVLRVARELLIAHELFHHLEATSLGPVHRTLPPMTLPLLGGFWKARRYIKRTREIAAHSFAFILLGMNERFPWTIDYRSTDRG
jgi:hypothetical protein